MVYPDTSLVVASSLEERLQALWERTGDDALGRLARGELPAAASATAASATAASATAAGAGDSEEGRATATEAVRTDWISTSLMDCYKNTGDAQVFALLFELNRASFLQAIQGKVRRCGSRVDPQDVLQEVFLNIYRYPHRFQAAKADSFRSWGHRIVRNTLLKFLKGQTRLSRFASLDDEVVERADARTRTPVRVVQEAESAHLVDRAYLLYLNLYLLHFERLSDRERRALSMVEVDGASYKEAAADLGIRLENLKMVIFRGRRKIFRGLGRTLADLSEHSPSR